jgi:hypothetical protein
MAAGIPSDFPPPDAKPHMTGCDRQGRRVTAEAAARRFVHVTGDYGTMWGREGTRGETPLRPVKSPALPTQVRILSLPHIP